MIRSIFSTLAAVVAISAISAQGCKTSGVGDPCIPEQEYDPTFLGLTRKRSTSSRRASSV